VGWSDGSTTTCEVMTENDECYLHAKYFDKVLLADGKWHYVSGPSPDSRFRANMPANQRYITSVYSPRRKVERLIGGEYAEE
jgi:hypothetical protein